MFTIKNKIRILSAVILAITTAATVLSSCGETTPTAPVETVIGTNGEILGVSVYTEENQSETQTVLYEITTKKKSIFRKKDKETKAETSAPSSQKMTIRNNSSGVTLVSRKENESTSRVRPTFPQTQTQKSSRVAAEFGENGNQTTKHVPVSYVPKSHAPKTTSKSESPSVKQTAQVNTTTKKGVSNEKINNVENGINIVFKTSSVEKGSAASIMIQGEPGKKYSIEFYATPADAANLSSLGDKTADENGFVSWTFDVPMNCESGNRKIIVKENGTENYAQTSINVK